MEKKLNEGRELFNSGSAVGDKESKLKADNELVGWLMGLSEEAPDDVKNKMDNAVSKINWLIACLVFSQAGQLIKQFEYLNKISDKVFNGEDINTISTDKAYKNFLLLSNHLNTFLEFARKFSLQNREFIADSGENEDIKKLVVLFKSLPKEKLLEIQSIVKDEV